MYKVGILGATGIVGQRIIKLLEGHKLFEIKALFASEANMGVRFSDIDWVVDGERPELDLSLDSVNDAVKYVKDLDFYFSALPSSVADKLELDLRKTGAKVISNASSHRMDTDVPLLVPEILDDLQDLKSKLKAQINKYGGFIATNPNCSTIGMVLASFPIIKHYGLKSINVTTMQAISGAGKRGLYSYDIFANVIPNISEEEEKIVQEFPKITNLNPKLVVRTNRVPVLDGHSFSILLETEKQLGSVEDIVKIYRDFVPTHNLPLLEDKYYNVYTDDFMPQVRKVAWLNRGLSTSVGRFKKVSDKEILLSAVSNNISRGAAGGTVLVAELVAELLVER